MSASKDFQGERGLLRQVLRVLQGTLREGFVEQHYSAATVAERLEVTERTVWNYVDEYDASGGARGIGPVVKLSHKVVRIPASAINRFLKSRTIASVPPAAASAEAGGEPEQRRVA